MTPSRTPRSITLKDNQPKQRTTMQEGKNKDQEPYFVESYISSISLGQKK